MFVNILNGEKEKLKNEFKKFEIMINLYTKHSKYN